MSKLFINILICFFIQKPTASQFYHNILEKYSLLGGEHAGIISIKNKVRNMKTAFIKANQWQNETGNGLLENGDTETVKGI